MHSRQFDTFSYLPISSFTLCLHSRLQLSLHQISKTIDIYKKCFGKLFVLTLLRWQRKLAQLLWRLKICRRENLLVGKLQGKESSLGDDKMGLCSLVICQGHNLGLCIESVNQSCDELFSSLCSCTSLQTQGQKPVPEDPRD